MSAADTSPSRLDGLDLARYLAFAGMLLVNFRIAMHPSVHGPDWLEGVLDFLQGKGSATFVALAGLGLVLATRRMDIASARIWIGQRAIFLLIVGLLNLAVFAADIIHYYAVYFLLAIPLIRAGRGALCLVAAAVSIASFLGLRAFDYAQDWNANTLEYEGLWTVHGFLRHLLFNGFHPVFPWLAILVFGMLLAQAPLHTASTQWRLVAGGIGAVAVAGGIRFATQQADLAWILGMAPMPPGPVYVAVAMGTSSAVIGACLIVARVWPKGPWRGVLPAGRMTLSLYLAHIFIGMGILDETGALDGSHSSMEAAGAASLFLLVATFGAKAWSLRYATGPVESLMRRLTQSSKC